MFNNTKSRILIKLLLSLAVGTLLTLFLLNQNGFENMLLTRAFKNLIYNHTIYIYFINAILFLLPSAILYFWGKKAYLEMMENDDDLDYELKKKASSLDSSMLLLSVFTAINLMQYGTLYHISRENPTTLLILFMLGIMITSFLQVSIVKCIQKSDSRLKGDPTRITFDKDFLESMDEAEQLNVFKSAYKAFQLTKTITLILMVSSILMNIIANTGAFAILMCCLFMIVQIVSFMYYERHTI